jgi:hypothetical protein
MVPAKKMCDPPFHAPIFRHPHAPSHTFFSPSPPPPSVPDPPISSQTLGLIHSYSPQPLPLSTTSSLHLPYPPQLPPLCTTSMPPNHRPESTIGCRLESLHAGSPHVVTSTKPSSCRHRLAVLWPAWRPLSVCKGPSCGHVAPHVVTSTRSNSVIAGLSSRGPPGVLTCGVHSWCLKARYSITP